MMPSGRMHNLHLAHGLSHLGAYRLHTRQEGMPFVHGVQPVLERLGLAHDAGGNRWPVHPFGDHVAGAVQGGKGKGAFHRDPG
jgi:hypothetical protein